MRKGVAPYHVVEPSALQHAKEEHDREYRLCRLQTRAKTQIDPAGQEHHHAFAWHDEPDAPGESLA
jgi:hypothetical protein